MADYKKYKVGITVKEPWADNISYEKLDMTLFAAENGGDGCAYVALKPNIGVRPNQDPTTWIKATQRGQSIYDYCIEYGLFVGTEEEFAQDYADAVQAAKDAAVSATHVEEEVSAAEQGRVSAENARVSAESQRASAEESRVSYEAQRSVNETGRVNAEDSRVAAENARVVAENQRASAESTRATNEENRRAEFGGMMRDAETAIGLVDAAITEAENVDATVDGMIVTITDRDGVSKSVNIGFDIYRTYGSVAAMNADAANVEDGKFVMIATLDPTSTENAQLWVRNSNASTSQNPFTFLSDLDQASSAAWADWMENQKPIIEADHTTASTDHATAQSDHATAVSDHAAVEVYVDSLGAYDISAAHASGGSLATYADITAALGANGANIPEGIRRGGMSVKFVQSSDHKYMQFRYMPDDATTNSEFTNIFNWQGVDKQPNEYSKNLVESGAIFNELNLTHTNTLTQSEMSTGAYGNDMTFIVSDYSRHIVLPIDGISSIRTVAGKKTATLKVPAIIYLSSSEPTAANKLGEQYAEGESFSSSVAVFDSPLIIPEGTTHAVIQIIKSGKWADVIVGYGVSLKEVVENLLPVLPVSNKNLIIVDINGNGDYTSLQEAINNAGDTAINPKTIIVLPGVYVMPTNYSRSNAQNRYLSIIGTDKNNCVVRNDVGYYLVGGGNYVDNSSLRLAGNVYVANLTIISTDSNYPSDAPADRHMSYCIHLDMNAPGGTVCEINNCVLINDHFACLGYGLRTNYTIKIVNCELTSTFNEENKATIGRGSATDYYATLSGHDGVGTSTEEITQHIEVRNCVITNTNDKYGVSYYNARDGLTDMTLINNVIDVPIGGEGFIKSSTASLTKKCFGNNIASMNYQ